MYRCPTCGALSPRHDCKPNAIDISTIKPGGKVSVTLTDGTKIVDSPVTEDRHGNRYFVNGLLVLHPFGGALPDDTVIDAYTPPAPEWDRPEVYAVRDTERDIWVRWEEDDTKWVTDTCFEKMTASRLEKQYGPCIVFAVYAKQVQP